MCDGTNHDHDTDNQTAMATGAAETPTMKSWRPEFLLDGTWASNAQRFATEEEAESSARSRFARWTAPTDYRAVPSPDPVNYRFIDGLDKLIS